MKREHEYKNNKKFISRKRKQLLIKQLIKTNYKLKELDDIRRKEKT